MSREGLTGSGKKVVSNEKKVRRLHPADYLIGENESFYTAMAEKGFLLEKRGAYFSTFRKAEPEELIYRIEVTSPGLFEENTSMSEEQKFLYEDSGWQFVTAHGMIHVFKAPAYANLPEFYSDPASQAKTLKAMRRNFILDGLKCWIYILAGFLSAALFQGGFGVAWGKWQANLWIGWVEATEVILFLEAFFITAAFFNIYRVWQIQKLYNRMKSGQYIDHEPEGKRIISGSIKCMLTAITLVLGFASLQLWIESRKQPLPAQKAGPYLELQDLGIHGERNTNEGSFMECTLKQGSSLRSDWWMTYENVTDEKGNYHWIRQHIYRLRYQQDRDTLVKALMMNSIFAEGEDQYEVVQVVGLDQAYKAALEYITVKGNVVSYIVYTDPSLYGGSTQ